eukprot:403359575
MTLSQKKIIPNSQIPFNDIPKISLIGALKQIQDILANADKMKDQPIDANNNNNVSSQSNDSLNPFLKRQNLISKKKFENADTSQQHDEWDFNFDITKNQVLFEKEKPIKERNNDEEDKFDQSLPKTDFHKRNELQNKVQDQSNDKSRNRNQLGVNWTQDGKQDQNKLLNQSQNQLNLASQKQLKQRNFKNERNGILKDKSYDKIQPGQVQLQPLKIQKIQDAKTLNVEDNLEIQSASSFEMTSENDLSLHQYNTIQPANQKTAAITLSPQKSKPESFNPKHQDTSSLLRKRSKIIDPGIFEFAINQSSLFKNIFNKLSIKNKEISPFYVQDQFHNFGKRNSLLDNLSKSMDKIIKKHVSKKHQLESVNKLSARIQTSNRNRSKEIAKFNSHTQQPSFIGQSQENSIESNPGQQNQIELMGEKDRVEEIIQPKQSQSIIRNASQLSRDMNKSESTKHKLEVKSQLTKIMEDTQSISNKKDNDFQTILQLERKLVNFDEQKDRMFEQFLMDSIKEQYKSNQLLKGDNSTKTVSHDHNPEALYLSSTLNRDPRFEPRDVFENQNALINSQVKLPNFSPSRMNSSLILRQAAKSLQKRQSVIANPIIRQKAIESIENQQISKSVLDNYTVFGSRSKSIVDYKSRNRVQANYKIRLNQQPITSQLQLQSNLNQTFDHPSILTKKSYIPQDFTKSGLLNMTLGNPTQMLFNDSSLESIRLNDEQDFHEYKAPKTFNKKKIKETLKWVLTPSTEKFKQGFLYPVESKAKLLPAPDSYENLPEVKSTRRFKIYMKAKKTLAQEILEKRDKTPGPGQYKTEQKVKIKGHYSNKLQRNAYIEEIEYLAKQCPGPNFYNLNYNSQDRRSISPNLKRDTTEKDTKLIRNNSPSPHTYKPEVVKDKFQIKLNKGSQQWAKAKDVKFIDQLIKQKNQIPGVGQYENLASSLDYQSKAQSPRYKRGI